MRERRGPVADAELCSGPGKLSQALGVGLEMSGAPLTEPPFLVGARAAEWQRAAIATGPRIGISKAVERPWRFCAAGNAHVSRPRLAA
jgi:DNA-3-methyladenine glycosylase